MLNKHNICISEKSCGKLTIPRNKYFREYFENRIKNVEISEV